MAKAIVYRQEESGNETYEGDIYACRIIRKDSQETNQPVISLGKAGTNYIDIEMTWDDAINLWDRLTGLVGREIIKVRVEDILYGKDTCHYCGAPYNPEGWG